MSQGQEYYAQSFPERWPLFTRYQHYYYTCILFAYGHNSPILIDSLLSGFAISRIFPFPISTMSALKQ